MANAEKQRDRFTGAQNFYQIEAAQSTTLSDQQRLTLSDEILGWQTIRLRRDSCKRLAEDATTPASAKFAGKMHCYLLGDNGWAAAVSEQVRVTRLNRLGLDPSVISQASCPIEFTPMAADQPD